MIGELKLKKIISAIILILGSIINVIGYFASRGSGSSLTTLLSLCINITLYIIICLVLKKYDFYIKLIMIMFGMILFPIILCFSAVPSQALLYNFIIPGFYAITIRKKKNIILPLLNGVIIAVIVSYRINILNSVIFFLVYCFNITVTALFTMTLFDNFQELERTYSLIADIAKKDRLTGIYNRFGLENAVRKKGLLLCYAIMIDIDFFKQVNDTYGHEAGDELLYKIGTILKEHGSKDFIVSRRGGEEFLIYSYLDFNQTVENLTAIYADVDSKIIIEGNPVHISAGISEQGYAGEELVADADKNLYLAKETGRNKVCVKMQDFEIARISKANK